MGLCQIGFVPEADIVTRETVASRPAAAAAEIAIGSSSFSFFCSNSVVVLVRREGRIGIERYQVFGLAQMRQSQRIIARRDCVERAKQCAKRDFKFPCALARIHFSERAGEDSVDMTRDVVSQLRRERSAKAVRSIDMDQAANQRMPALNVPDHVDELREEAARRGTGDRFGAFCLEHGSQITARALSDN